MSTDNKRLIYWKEQMIKKVACDHPLVERIWEYGALAQLPTNSQMVRVLCLKIKDIDEPIKFEDSGDDKAVEEAEQYLKSLP